MKHVSLAHDITIFNQAFLSASDDYSNLCYPQEDETRNFRQGIGRKK